ncbi:MAG TPA: TetR/AcrR family transcriptional regulator [Acidimicrobiia bacterium]|nr:TetR/AcrR family transcriptional regulator [Acidimicrobiia bacterium]
MTTEMVGAEHSAREMEIIRSAYRTMAKRGSHRMSLRDVAEEAGVSKALILYHFGTKDALLFAAMKWAVERTAERIRGGLEATDLPEDQISALIDAIFIEPVANREFYLFYLDLIEHAGRVPSFGTLSATLEEIINGLYAEVIQEGVDAGVFDVANTAVASRHMRALIEGTFLQWIQTDDWQQSHPVWKTQCREALLRLLVQ